MKIIYAMSTGDVSVLKYKKSRILIEGLMCIAFLKVPTKNNDLFFTTIKKQIDLREYDTLNFSL